jgi:hypothetical protein
MTRSLWAPILLVASCGPPSFADEPKRTYPSPVEQAARWRAATEFNCPREQVVVTPTGIQDNVDVTACGNHAVYTCPSGRFTTTCVRER